MNATLETALKAEGLDDAAINRVSKVLSDAMLTVTFDNYRHQTQMRLAEEQRERERKAAALAAAVPYTGSIPQCQAEVHNGGRSWGWHRCPNKPKFVRRIGRDNMGDGRLAVCKTHLNPKWSDPFRHTRAVERVEPEYQPS